MRTNSVYDNKRQMHTFGYDQKWKTKIADRKADENCWEINALRGINAAEFC